MESNTFLSASLDPDYLADFIDFINKNLNSHLILESCKVLGIPHDQIFQKTLTDFEDHQSNKSVQILRFQHYEARRKACLSVIAQYLSKQDIFCQLSKNKLTRSHSIGAKSKDQPDIVPYVPISPRQASARKLKIAKENIIKRIRVEQKKKNLRKKFDEDRVIKEQMINNKLSKSVKKDHPSKFFEVHDKRVQEILKKKYQDQLNHEAKSPIYPDTKKEELRPHSSSFQSYNRISYESQHKDEEIEEKLKKISSKLSSSYERAKKNLQQRAVHSNLSSKFHPKAKEDLESKQEFEKILKIAKIQQNLADSNKRRGELIFNEQRKRALSAKAMEVRHIEEQLKNEQEMIEKMKEMENKEEKREKSRQVRKDIIEKTVQAISNRNFVRKREQERNLKEIDRELKYLKNGLIEKIRDWDGVCKGKILIDYAKLKKRVEREMQKNGDIV